MRKIRINDDEQITVKAAVQHVKNWCSEHQAEVGGAEIALGAGLLALGVHNGVIEMGKQLVGTATTNFNLESEIGAALGAATGGVGAYLIGSIGVVTAGSGIGIPALLLAGGAALLLGTAGYAAGDLVHNFVHPPIGMTQLLGNVSLLVVGVALVVDGARRIAKDQRVRAKTAFIRDGVIHLYDLAVATVVRNRRELDDIRQLLSLRPASAIDAAGGIGSAAAGAMGGAAVGGAVAAGGVTLLGSSSLGAAALSLGLVSAPLWPAIAGGAAGLGLGFAAWKTGRYLIMRHGWRQERQLVMLSGASSVSDEDHKAT